MSTLEALIIKTKELPEQQQREVLALVDAMLDSGKQSA